MDRTMQSPLSGSRSPFTPKSRQNISKQRLTLTLTPNAFKKSSRFSVSGRSTQSIQVIAKSPYNYVERFGQSLPVLITEALTYADRSIIVTTRISEIGYAWLVCGRRLLIWQYRQSPTLVGTPQRRQNISNQCFELLLPQSDLAHRAQLVSVFISTNSHIPSCIAVSPEGVVRYWPSVAHEGVSVEQIVDLQGQECDSLTDVGNMGCILATTTCTVVLVQPQMTAGRHSLNCHTLRTPSGWLGGISKKMSSLIFGPLSSEHTAETRLVRVLSVKQEEENLHVVYVLAGHSLQKWHMSPNQQEHLIFVAELNRLVRDGFHFSVWESCGGDQTEMDTWLLDIQPDKDGVILLAAAVNMHVSPQVHYALICVQTNNLDRAPTQLRDFMILKLSGLYREDNPAESLSYRFLVSGTTAYLFNQRSITVVRPQEDPDTLDFHAPGDLLLGGSICVNTPIFFSRVHGLVSVSATDQSQADFNLSVTSPDIQDGTLNESVLNTASNLTLYNIDPEEMYNAYKDTLGQFKAAFIFHIKNQQTSCKEILEQLFPLESTAVPGVDAFLDKVVLTVAEMLLDDYPSGDPRWNKDNPVGLGSSFAMHILHQLHDKQKAFDLFIDFLHQTNLWNRLAAVNVRDSTFFTVHALGELSEKIVAAIELKNSNVGQILEDAIEKVVAEEQMEYEHLLPQDLFYRQVTKIHRVLQEIVKGCDEIIHSDSNPTQIATHIMKSNELLLNVLKEVIQHRQTKAEDFTVSISASSLSPDYLPWTSAAGTDGLSESLMLQQSLTINYGARVVGDLVLRNTLYDQFVNLIDIILDGRKCHLESVKGTTREDVLLKQYETDRKRLIHSLVTDKEWERAALLSEKYLDLELLVIICESTDNQQRLDEYMERFSNEGFSEFVYSWYMQENKQGKLIARCKTNAKPTSAHTLNKFLADHPSLSWIQNIYDKKFGTAAEILKKLAIEEKESVTKQKTILSLSKLAKLASTTDLSSGEEYINDLNNRLDLITFQEEIPDYVLQAYGYETIRPKVILPQDMIELYICPEYKDSTEIDFKKALDLLNYISDESLKNELTLKIWRKALLKDTWTKAKLNSPLEALQNTLFFRIFDVAVNLGANPQEVLPPLELLIADEEMQSLQENPNFQYLIKMGYEHVCNG